LASFWHDGQVPEFFWVWKVHNTCELLLEKHEYLKVDGDVDWEELMEDLDESQV